MARRRCHPQLAVLARFPHKIGRSAVQRCAGETLALPASYQPLLELTTLTTSSITGTSINTPTTVASAAPELKPNRLMAAATASSKKFDAPISAEGQATLWDSPARRFNQYARAELKNT